MNEATVPGPEQDRPASGSGIEVGSSMPDVSKPNETVKKVVVAVHGIGDQYSFATIQSVVNQFCVYYGQPAAVPLGNFHSGQPAYSLLPPYPPEPFERLAFAEVYWASIARDVANEKHTLEEAKRWARTIVERLRLRWYEEKKKKEGQKEAKKPVCRDEDFQLTQQVLGEMIQTIAVVDRLCFLADKAGLFTFDLKKLLDDYLGDVQIVAEFKDYRDKILATFAKLLEDVAKAFPKADIYLVAHSEGTVVALLGLLQAFRKPDPPRWTQKVRGLMTLGSPIDKHLALWPELFGKGQPSRGLERKIEWRNYYDFGDPVGFNLDSIREWIEVHHWQDVFNFQGDKHDFGFTRYPFPGKAHVDYWTDGAVFGHFISTVVETDRGDEGKDEGKKDGSDRTKTKPPSSQPSDVGVKRRVALPAPGSLRGNQWLSYLVPYAGVLALLFIAAYLLYKAVTEAIGGAAAQAPTSLIFTRAAGLAALLFGVTAVARIPRLTRSRFWRTTSFAIAGLGAFVYMWSVGGAEATLLDFITLGLAILVVSLAFVVSVMRPSWGLIPLMVIGTVAVAAMVVYYVKITDASGPLWPVFLATVAFLYLWWLAALLFDLVFIWHLYIRHSKLMWRINEILGTYKERISPPSPQPAPAELGAGRGAPVFAKR